MKYLFKNGTVVSGRGTRRADVLVEDEKINQATNRILYHFLSEYMPVQNL